MSRAQLQLLRQILRAGDGTASLSIEQMRRNFDTLFSRFPAAPDVAVSDVAISRADGSTLRCAWVDARTDRSSESDVTDAAILHLHGGGFVVGSAASHRSLASRLSLAADAPVLLPEYRLAPEHVFPAQRDDALTAWRWLRERADRVAVSGDSAGAGLGVSLALALRDAGETLPSCLVCLCPWVDFAGTTASLDAHAHLDPMVQRPGLERMSELYLGGADPWDPDVTPLRADLRGLPSVLIQAGGEETLLDDARRLAARMEEHGVDVRLDVWDRMIHVWHLFAGRLDEGSEALAAAGAFARAALAGR